MCPYAFWIELSKFLLPFVIGGATLYIAWQQWKTNKLKYSLDLYERLKIYDEVKQILTLTMQSNSPGHDAILNFYRSTSHAIFLFESDITDYIEEIYNHLLKLQEWSDQYRDFNQHIPDDYDGKKISTGIHDESIWLTHQLSESKLKFKKHLTLYDDGYCSKIRHSVRRFFRR